MQDETMEKIKEKVKINQMQYVPLDKLYEDVLKYTNFKIVSVEEFAEIMTKKHDRIINVNTINSIIQSQENQTLNECFGGVCEYCGQEKNANKTHSRLGVFAYLFFFILAFILAFSLLYYFENDKFIAFFNNPKKEIIETFKPKKVDRPIFATSEHLNYLDELERNHHDNLFGMRGHLKILFPDLSKEQAQNIIHFWLYERKEK